LEKRELDGKNSTRHIPRVTRLPKNKSFIHLIFNQISYTQANNPAKIAHVFCLKNNLKPKLERPEYQSRHNPHHGIKHKGARIMDGIGCAKAEYVIFVEPVLYNQACSRAKKYRKKYTPIADMKTQKKVLRKNIHKSRYCSKKKIQ
jgi:hypothetical protein